MRRVPGRLEADDVLVRPWRVEDAEALRETIIASATHVPSWMAQVPKHFVDLRPLIARWEREWSEAHQQDLPSAEVLLELGYRLVEEKVDKAAAPGATSIDYVWLIDREQWHSGRETLIDAPEIDRGT